MIRVLTELIGFVATNFCFRKLISRSGYKFGMPLHVYFFHTVLLNSDYHVCSWDLCDSFFTGSTHRQSPDKEIKLLLSRSSVQCYTLCLLCNISIPVIKSIVQILYHNWRIENLVKKHYPLRERFCWNLGDELGWRLTG